MYDFEETPSSNAKNSLDKFFSSHIFLRVHNFAITKFNKNNEFISSFPLSNSDEIYNIGSFIINSDNNLVIIYIEEDTSSIFNPYTYHYAKYDLQGNLLDSSYLGNNLYSLEQFSDSTYCIISGGLVYHYDKNFNLLHSIPTGVGYAISAALNESKDKIYFSSPHEETIMGVGIHTEKLFSYSQEHILDEISEMYIDTFTFIFQSLKGIDTKYGTIFFSNALDLPCRLFFLDCEDEFTLNSVQDDGTVNWSLLLGGDAGYLVRDVVATQDSGCMIFFDRYKHGENYSHEYDLYYAKFDKEGNFQNHYLDSTYVGISSIPEDFNYINLYPNPVKDYLLFDSNTDLKKLKLEIYTLLGEKVYSKQNLQDRTDVRFLSKGTYTYIIYNDKKIKTAQFIKL